METLTLTSRQNSKVKGALKLWDRRDRDETGRFLIEGFREITRALEGGQPIERLFFSPLLFLGNNERALLERCREMGAECLCCDEKVFKALSYRDRPDGLLAIGLKRAKTLADLPLVKNPLYIVAEAIEKPGNLGTILRSADAAGAHAVIVCDRCTDIYNPNVVRASCGTLFTLPVVEAAGVEVLAWLKKRGICLVAATPSATDVYTQVDLRRGCALLVGTEQYGLSERLLKEADCQVRIPMHGAADSLNVATATTLLLYEAVRQRSGS